MYTQTWFLLALSLLTVWVVYNMARPFGWLSPLRVSHCFVKHHNGARYEILLIHWKQGVVRSTSQLEREITKSHHAFAHEIDMIVLVEEMDLPSGISIQSRVSGSRVLVVDTFPLRKDHVRRTTDTLGTGNYDAYAVISQELVDMHDPHEKEVFMASKKDLTVA